MSRAPAFLAILTLASTACQSRDAALQMQLVTLEQRMNVLQATVAKVQENVTSLAGVADPQKCVKATSPGVQSVGTYLVAELELGAHAQGAMLHGLLINPTALTLESVQYSVVPFVNPETVNPDAPAPSESKLSVLQKIPPGAGAAFSVLLPGVQPASVRAVCFEFESATYTYGVVASRRRPQ